MKKYLLLLYAIIGFHLITNGQKRILSRTYQAKRASASVGEFLQELKLNSGVILEYSSNNLDTEKIIQLDKSENTIGLILQKILAGQHLKLFEQNNKIILVPSTEQFNIDAYLPSRHSLFGYIKEAGSKEPLIDATVYDLNSRKGTLSNSYGYFSLPLTDGLHKITISYAGMDPVTLEVFVQGNIRKDISLSVSKQSYFAVVIQSPASDKDGSLKIEASKLAPYNFLLGEADPVRASYIQPGVEKVSEPFFGYLVRGGGTGENLFLLDGNPVYNPTHMLGALSIINQTVVKSMRLYKSDFPARFSDAISSVMDVYTKQGNMESWHGEANGGLLAGSFTLEGPISKNKTSLMISSRHSLSLPFYTPFQKGISSSFYDAHLKITNILSPKSKLSISGYKGQDRLKQTGTDVGNLHQWGNLIGSISWNYILGAKSFINTSVNLSEYHNLGSYQYILYQNDDDQQVVQTRSVGTYSDIEQYNAKSQAEIYASKKIKINAGIKAAQSIIKPFNTKISDSLVEDQNSFTTFAPLISQELSAYLETEVKTGRHLFIKPGVNSTFYHFKDYHTLTWQPRLFVSYRLKRFSSLFASYSRMNQFLHLVTNPYLGVNNDLWVPSTAILKPEKSDIYNVGYSHHGTKGWKFTVEAYYKKMISVTNFEDGKSYFINGANWQENIESGKGRSYGSEYKLEKRGKKLSFQLAYTLSWSFRQFSSINNGNEFPYKYDRRHYLNAGINYSINRHLETSIFWTYSSGEAYTLPNLIYPDFDNAQQIATPNDPLSAYRFIYHYSGVNQYRSAPFQRMDFAINYQVKNKTTQSLLTAGVYDINGSEDQYNFTLRGSLSSKSIIVKTGNSILNLTPYISYTFKF